MQQDPICYNAIRYFDIPVARVLKKKDRKDKTKSKKKWSGQEITSGIRAMTKEGMRKGEDETHGVDNGLRG